MDERNCRYCGVSIDHRSIKAVICEKPDCYRASRAEYARQRAVKIGWRGVAPKKLVDRICDRCGVAFQGRNDEPADKRFCSEACKDAFWALKAVRVNGRKLTRKERLRLVDFEVVDRQAVFDRDGWLCGICKEPIDPNLKSPHPRSVVIDHIIPLAGLMGTHEMSNVQAAHKRCNETKSDKPLFRR